MKIKKIFFLIPLLLLPIKGFALGFGSINVFSKLNEPLKVQIELVDSKAVNIDDLIVRNASKNIYRRADLTIPDGFNRVKFKSVKKADGSVIIELTSKKPFRELYVTFIADLNWKNVHLNREYTFFLDPPTLKKNLKKSKKVSAQQKSVSSTTNKINPTSYTPKVIQGDSYLVKYSDTLSQISRRVRPDNSVTSYQTMKALFALNPKAFINNNIDLLKQGYRLTIPSKEEIQQFNRQALKPATDDKTSSSTKATATIKQKPAIKTKAATVEPAMEKAAEVEPAIEKVPEEEPIKKTSSTPQLKIVPPSEELLNQPVDDDVLELMTKTLKTSHETITLLKKENALLSERIEKLTQKLSNFDEKNKDLNGKIDRITTLLEQQKTTPAKTIAEKPQQSSQLAIESQISNPDTNKQTFLQRIMANQEFLLIVMLGIILLFAIIIMSQRRSNRNNNVASSDDKAQEKFSAKVYAATEQKKDTNQTESEFSEFFDKSSTQTEQSQSTTTDQPSTTSEKELNLDESLEEYIPSELSSSSEATLREVNTFIAYGKYDNAEKLLLNVLEKAPENKLLHIKLLEIYADTNKSNEFTQHLEKVTQILNTDIEFRQHIEKIYQHAWDQPLNLG